MRSCEADAEDMFGRGFNDSSCGNIFFNSLKELQTKVEKSYEVQMQPPEVLYIQTRKTPNTDTFHAVISYSKCTLLASATLLKKRLW